MTEMTVNQVLRRTNWDLLARQKQTLLELREADGAPDEHLDGLVNWIDALQDAAEADGFPVVFLTDEVGA